MPRGLRLVEGFQGAGCGVWLAGPGHPTPIPTSWWWTRAGHTPEGPVHSCPACYPGALTRACNAAPMIVPAPPCLSVGHTQLVTTRWCQEDPSGVSRTSWSKLMSTWIMVNATLPTTCTHRDLAEPRRKG